MTRTEYYTTLKALARRVRSEQGLTTPKVTLTDMRAIYKAYGIVIKLWNHRLKGVRGAYTNDASGAHVMIAGKLPAEQRIYTMAHELKHHLTDRSNTDFPAPANDKEAIEIGAQVFAAELIYPEQDFVQDMEMRGIGANQCTAEVIVRLKRDTGTTLSHGGLAKRAIFLKYARPGVFDKVHWRKVEEEIFGEPLYKEIIRKRQASSATSL